MKYVLFIIQFCIATVPYHYLYESLDNNRENEGLLNNSIIDIEFLNDKVFLSTSSGLGYSEFDGLNFNFYHYDDENLPIGGNPSMVINNNVIAVSGSETVFHGGSNHPAGTGVSYSIDGGQAWNYMPQPIDEMPELWSCSNYNYPDVFYDDESECEADCLDCDGVPTSCKQIYDYISWGGQNKILHLSVTTEINNVSYDLDILGDYIYSASWAGGLRRFKYTLNNPVWEGIPLPMDDQDELLCGNIDVTSYELNPVGKCSEDFDNHKVFSIHTMEDTLWVGTAEGVNKGVVTENHCIDWTHLTSYNNNLFDDWVIDFEHQIIDENNYRIWAITWEKDSQGRIGPPSYSDDGGQNWTYPSQLFELGVKAYNISIFENFIFLATNLGLYLSDDGEYWEKFNAPVDYEDNEQVLSEVVYDSEVIDNRLWVGTQDGVAISNSFTSPEWMVYRFWEEHSAFDVYPNPFLIDSYNLIDGDGHVRFIYPGQNFYSTIDIFDFSMDRVITLDSPISIDNQIEFIWNGKTDSGKKVANGIYFCRLSDNGTYKWVKLAILGAL